MTSRYAEVHIKAQALRRKLAAQSKVWTIEKNRRFLEGLAASPAEEVAYRRLGPRTPMPTEEINYEYHN